MDKKIENAVKKMKAMIDRNGPDYLHEEPYLVYKELNDSDSTDIKVAGAILLTLTMGIDRNVSCNDNLEELSKLIQKECCLNQEMSDILAEVFLTLYSRDNENEWKEKNLSGWTQFQNTSFDFTWEGFSVWRVSNGSVDCHFHAEIVLKPGRTIKANRELLGALKDNPFMTQEAITKYYQKKISEYLDCEFEEYCTCEDYYEPVAEDFEIDYYVKKWCTENGFTMVLCEGDGHDDGYEPSF